MNNCRNCGAQVPPEKAWCPQCNEPVEAEARRTVEREIDSFAGTLIKKPKPRPAEVITPPSRPKPVTPPPVAPAQTPSRGPETAANPAIATGSMPAVVVAADASVVPPHLPAPSTPHLAEPDPSAKKDNSRLVIYVAVGLVLGLVLLVVMIAVAIILWNSSAR